MSPKKTTTTKLSSTAKTELSSTAKTELSSTAKAELSSTAKTDKHVGSRLRQRRSAMGMTQEKLAEELGVTFQQIQKYESGSNRISASRLYDLSRTLAVPVAFFFTGLNDPHIAPLLPDGFAEDGGAGPVPPKPSLKATGKKAGRLGQASKTQKGGAAQNEDTEAAQLLALFQEVRSAKLRQQILDLVRALAKSGR